MNPIAALAAAACASALVAAADATCTSTLISFDVALAAPTPTLIRLLSALMTLWNPCVETSPTERAEMPEMAAFTLVTRPSTLVAAADTSA